MKLHAKIKHLRKMEIPDQEFGNTKLNVMPFMHNGSYIKLPIEYAKWEKSLNEIMRHVPVQLDALQHYITINSDFFTKAGVQRREGVHMDGNFCVDPTFIDEDINVKAWDTTPTWGKLTPIKAWGGVSPKPSSPKPSWGGMGFLGYREMPDNSHVIMDWVLPYNIIIPIAKYVSDTKGGLLVVSSDIGTRAWAGIFNGQVAAEGSFHKMQEQLTDDKLRYIPKNTLMFMTSNTPHETLPIKAGIRRTFMRVTLNHNYNNTQILAA